jgi:hypothetical protein
MFSAMNAISSDVSATPVPEGWGDIFEKSAWDQYISEMSKHFRLIANWTPGDPRRIGDIGILNHGMFERISTLDAMEIGFDIRQDSTFENLKYSSSSGVSMTFKGSGKAPLPGSLLTEAVAGFSIEFSRKHATVFEATGCVTHSVSDELSLGEKIFRLYETGQWNRGWRVLVKVVECDACTVLISSSSAGKLELSIKGNLTAPISIADSSAEFGVVTQRDMNTVIIASKGLTPLYQVLTIDDYINNRVTPSSCLSDKDSPCAADVYAPSALGELFSR